MSPEPLGLALLPDQVRQTLDELRTQLDLDLALWVDQDGERVRVYPDSSEGEVPSHNGDGAVRRTIAPRDGPAFELVIGRSRDGDAERVAGLLTTAIERTYDFSQEIRFFTYELSERYEEINLLYSISETLGSILRLDDAARVILGEVCDVLGAKRGSLWVHETDEKLLRLTASVGEEGLRDPLPDDDPDAVTAAVFREGRSMIATRPGTSSPTTVHGVDVDEADSFLSVPIRYTPPAGEPRTVGVINLIGRRHGGRFTASDQKLLSAIASQVGAALENNRLIQESLAQERVAREMELAHDLQMKLLPDAEKFEGAVVAARVEPADSVGGDFYHLFKLPAGKVGVMIGDVSSHGFPAALIMALSMSAATIYATEFPQPAKVLRHIDDALRDELETTEMYLTLFYAVLDPAAGSIVYANAGHPHAFLVRGDGSEVRLDATDPPVGIAGPGSYAQESTTLDPARDLLFLFTDGISDLLAGESEGNGEDALLDHVRANRERTPAQIVQGLFALTDNVTATTPPDDRTAIVVRL